MLTNDTDADTVLGDKITINGVRAGAESAGGVLTAVSGSLSLTGIYGTLAINAAGSYIYTLNNADPDTRSLTGGATVTDVFTYRLVDSKGLSDTAQLTITIKGANDAPVITSNGGGTTASISIAENMTAVTMVTSTDPDAGATKIFSISGGADAVLFTIDATTGALSFKAAPNFEAPGDAGGDNVYNVTVRVSDGSLTDTQALKVTVTNVAGVSITGTSGDDTVNATTAPAGQPLPTGEEDRILGLDGNDKLSAWGAMTPSRAEPVPMS